MKALRFVTLFVLGALADSPAQAATSPHESQPISRRGTPGVADRHAVVNVADLPVRVQVKGDLAASDVFTPAAIQAPVPAAASTPENPSPPPASSFSALLDIADGYNAPDSHGAIGPNHIVTSVNIRMKVQDRVGTTLRTISYVEFWNPLALQDELCCDHRVLYDPYEDRWIVVGLTGAGTRQPASLIAVSQTGDPLGRWNQYRIAGDVTGQNYPDFPRIGFSRDWVVVQSLLLRNSDSSSVGYDIYALSKTNLYAGGDGAFTLFQLRGEGIAPHPVTTYDPALSTFYLIAASNGPFATGVTGTTNLSELKIFSIAGNIGAEVLTEAPPIKTGHAWDAFPLGGRLLDATNRQVLPQLGSVKKISAPVGTIADAKFRNGTLWAVHGVHLPPGGSPTRVAIQWWQLGLDGTVLQHGLIDDPSGVEHYAYSSIAVNRYNDLLIGYSSFSSNQFASANYSFRYGTDAPGTLRGDTVLKAGEGPYRTTVDFLGTRVRWGDYSHTTVDPLNDTDLWTIQEYAAAPSGGSDRWGTWWGRIAPSGSFLTATNVTVTEGDSGSTNIFFSFTMSRPTNVIVSVDYATADGTAQAGSDYAATSGTLVFAPGETNGSVVIPVLGDVSKETNEIFYLTLSNPTNVSPSYGRLEARIIDTDPLPTITLTDIAVREGDAGTTDATFTLALAPASGLPASLRLITANNSAVLRVDYAPTNLVVTFPPGITTATATVKIIGDTLLETNETFYLTVSAQTNAILGSTRGVCTILDDDFKVAVQSTAAGAAKLSFATQTNRTYRVERTDDLAPPIVWSLLPGTEALPGNGSNVTVLDSGALNQPKRFYRVLTP